MPAPESIDAGIADGTYRQALEPPIRGGTDDAGEWVIAPYFVPWEYRRDFEQGLLGVSKSSGGLGSWSANSPYSRSDFPGMFAFNTQWEPTGTITLGDVPSYSDCLIYVTFRTPTFNFSGGFNDPYYAHSITPDAEENQAMLWATQEMDYSIESFAMEEFELQFRSDGKKPGTPFIFHSAIADMMITWLRVPFLPRGVLNFRNTLNGVTFLNQPKGHVRLAGAKTQLKTWTDGQRVRTLTLHFRIAAHDWNAKPRVSGGGVIWDILETSSGNTVIPYAEYRDLLQYLLLSGA